MKTATRVSYWRHLLTLLCLGFSAGLPLLLLFSTLSLWLLEAGIERKTVTMFSWAALGYSFKFLWSPLMDSISWKLLGKRRGWLLLAQILMILGVLIMAWANPNPAVSGSLNVMAMGSLLLGFAAATQDVAIDAYRIEIVPDNAAAQSALSAAYTAGYRAGMIASGAGSLWLAAYLGSSKAHYVYEAWRNTYFAMAGLMGVGVLTTLLIKEPEIHHYNQNSENNQNNQKLSVKDNVRLLLMFVCSVVGFVLVFRVLGEYLPTQNQSPVMEFVWESVKLLLSLGGAVLVGLLTIKMKVVSADIARQTYWLPVHDFFVRYGKKALILLALIGLYRISDIVSGVISNVFYSDLGFSKQDIAMAVKTFGVAMSVFGGLIGGVLAQKFNIMKMMMLGVLAAASTNLLFVWLAMKGHDVPLMYTAVGLDNFAAGLAGTVFVAFLSALTNIRFTAVQYALFSSLMTLFPKVLGGYSGAMVDKMGYEGFFLFTALLSVPIVFLVVAAEKILFPKSK